MTIAFLMIALFAMLLVGVPVAIALGLSTIAAFYFFTDTPVMILAQRLYANLDHFPLMAVPFFLLAGQLAQTGGLARRLIALSQTLIGHVSGGLALSGVLSCMFFAAASGSSSATVAAIGSILFPAMIRAGYPDKLAIGGLTTAGSLGILIPPSIPLIIYGLVTETSVGRLFIAGILPGILLGSMLLLTTYLAARNAGLRRSERATAPERRAALKDAGWSLLLPVIVIGGIYGIPEMEIGDWYIPGGGLFTPTEASVAAVVYTFIIGRFVYGELPNAKLFAVFRETLHLNAMLLFIVANAVLFGFLLTSEQIPTIVSDWVADQELSQWVFLLAVNVILGIAGQFMDGIPIVMIFVPILFAAAQAVGVDPVHFGIIVTVNLELGTITPPVGVNLFVASAITKIPLHQIIRATLPWTGVVVFVLLIVTYVPQVSLFLVRLLY